MRGLYSSKTKIRNQIFTEVARFAYEGGDYSKFENLPYEIIPGEISTYRESIFLERAIVGERLRLAMGLPLLPVSKQAPISTGVEESMIDEKVYDPPLINIIKFACHKCAEKRVVVTDGCQGCLEHPCTEVCPKGAISIVHGKSHIDDEKCIKCGKCQGACPYNAIIKQERPCAAACGMKAIHSDEHGRADIDYNKCVSCGMCLVSCPFSAIVDKSQIFQTIMAINSGTPVYAAVAPAIAGQFKGLPSNKIRNAFKALGFTDVVEVAVGADFVRLKKQRILWKKFPKNSRSWRLPVARHGALWRRKLSPTLLRTFQWHSLRWFSRADLQNSIIPIAELCLSGHVPLKSLRQAAEVSEVISTLC